MKSKLENFAELLLSAMPSMELISNYRKRYLQKGYFLQSIAGKCSLMGHKFRLAA